MKQLSILLPSAYPEKRERFIKNLKETTDFDKLELVVCLDGERDTWKDGNITYCYSPPTKYRSTFFDKAYKESTGRYCLMANDDVEFKTKGWDKLIPYCDYPDDLVLFYFKDNEFNNFFSCHPVFSRKVMELGVNFNPGNGYKITKCDNTIWDVMPTGRRVYLDNIELEHRQVKDYNYTNEAYKEDNVEYLKHEPSRAKVRSSLYKMVTDSSYKVFIGVCTAEQGRRADFYDYVMNLERPVGSMYSSVHGQAIARNRNIIAKHAVDLGMSHVLFIDDDVIFQPHSLYQLLHHDKDIITALQLKREYPHPPLVFDKEVDGGMLRHMNLKHGQTGLVPIVASGMGFCLIKTEVFKGISYPYFTMGHVVPDSIGEDVYFYRQARAYKAYCDLDLPVGHISSIVVKPYQMAPTGKWAIDYHSNGSDPVRLVHPQSYS